MIKIKYWFRQKKYGYGFTPISLAGWLMTFFFIFFILLIFYSHNFFLLQGPDKKEIIQGVTEAILAMAVFFHYFEKKTQGELKWRWGNEQIKPGYKLKVQEKKIHKKKSGFIK